MLVWQYDPRSDPPPGHLLQVIGVFERHARSISSVSDAGPNSLSSDAVLAHVRDDLGTLGWRVEAGKKAGEKISVPVLFGRNGVVDKSFEADAFDEASGTVLEVEAGRAVANNAFLKDLFQACMMHDARYLAIAVRRMYLSSPDFERVCTFFDTLYASHRLKLPLEGILVLGY